MAYKLLEMAPGLWRRLNSAHLLPLVPTGMQFVDGAQEKRAKENTGEDRKEAA